MIEKLEITAAADPFGPLSLIQDKINELIDAYNKLGEAYENHYHYTTLDTEYHTTGPKESV